MKKTNISTLLLDLIKIPSYISTSPKVVNENKLVDYIFDWLKSHTDLEVEKQPLDGGRFNLVAKKGNPDTIFLGHTDTVAPSQDAPINQLKPEIIDGYIWGRGATDMKSGVAAMIAAIEAVPEANNFWLMLYADEEYDFLGMKELVKKYLKIRPKLLISADGSDLEIGHGCRGLIEFTARIIGETGHPAKGMGRNAVYGTAVALTELQNYLNDFSHPIMGQTSYNVAYMYGGTKTDASIVSNRLRSVQDYGNMVPDICEVKIDIRPATPDLNAKKIISEFKRLINSKQLDFELVQITHDLGAWYTDQKGIKQYSELVKKIGGSEKFSDPKSTGYLDLQMLWAKVGQPTSLMFGGGVGMTAHKPDERILIKDLEKTRDFFIECLKLSK